MGQRQHGVPQTQPRHSAGTLLGQVFRVCHQNTHPRAAEATHGCHPCQNGDPRCPQTQESGVIGADTGLTQYPSSSQQRGRQRRGTGPPSRAELSPVPLASAVASQAPSARRDLGAWGRSGGEVRVQFGAPWPPQSGPKIRGRSLPLFSGSLCRRARGNTRPGPSRAALRGHKGQGHVLPAATPWHGTQSFTPLGDSGPLWLPKPFPRGSPIWDSP